MFIKRVKNDSADVAFMAAKDLIRVKLFAFHIPNNNFVVNASRSQEFPSFASV